MLVKNQKRVPNISKLDLYIKESKKITKFKLRGKKYLFTFKTADKNKAAKI
jgi:large subunit ribosomal protein L38e